MPRTLAGGLGGALRTFVEYASAIALASLIELAVAHANDGDAQCGGFNREAAVQACSRIIDRKPTPSSELLAIAHYNRAVAEKDGGDVAAARRDLDASIGLKPLASAYFLRGVIAMDAHNYDVALRDYGAALQLDPHNAAIVDDQAIVLDARGEFAAAVKVLDAALKYEPGNATVLNERGNILGKLGRTADAERDWRKAASLDAQIAGIFKQNQRFVRVMVPPKYPLPVDVAAVRAGSRVALVVGNSSYRFAGTLANPGNDAKLIAKTLQDLGFDVTLKLDADYDLLTAALADFTPRASKADVAAIFYAGHGIQLAKGNTGENFILPVDFKLTTTEDVESQAIAAARLLAAMGQAQSRLLILDACRDNPFAAAVKDGAVSNSAGQTRRISRGFARVQADNGVSAGGTEGGELIVFSAAANQLAQDTGGDGGNSPFSAALAKYLRWNGLEVKDVIVHVGQDVQNQTGRKQIPFLSSSLVQEVYLAGH